MRMEIRPAEGGADAESFAVELGRAISTHTGSPMERDGRSVIFSRL